MNVSFKPRPGPAEMLWTTVQAIAQLGALWLWWYAVLAPTIKDGWAKTIAFWALIYGTIWLSLFLVWCWRYWQRIRFRYVRRYSMGVRV
jgi:hypothetical protein